ncbi:FCD domain-containing protein [Chelatococcus sp. XZ-Ab1]|uniref:FadR/GntR family transcriptional regulator n=1 Tax=Chelatococcus sp. XZ-Ab1 TaxID=3034027 RepID=UPI0023E448FA|nr:FCD domain-containing protein [Chelatococcus sp. XZ-Ab1]
MTPAMPRGREHRSVPMKTAEAIEAMIRARGLAPGDQLPAQRTLAQDLGISRPSLREALSVLETLGIVRIEIGRGVFVAPREEGPKAPSWRFRESFTLAEVFEMRLAVEGLAAMLAAPRMPQPARETLAASAQAMGNAARRGDVVGAAEADTVFHDLVVAHCGNRLLQEVHGRTHALTTESQRVPMVARNSLFNTADEHFAILAAFVERNGERARAAMEAHIRAAAGRAGIHLGAGPAVPMLQAVP